MKRLIVMGSPRSAGRSGHLAEMLFEACIDECPEDELYLAPVSELVIEPCLGCDACRHDFADDADAASGEEGDVPHGGGQEPGESAEADESDEPDYPCCLRYDDDMQDLYPVIAQADELIVVSPVFFSGAPASLKALLDRLQPHYWAGTRFGAKKSASLHIVGEGGDPHGFGALISEVRSAGSCAGFHLERVLSWVGKIDSEGNIQEEADLVEGPEQSEGEKRPSRQDKQDKQYKRDKQDKPTSSKRKERPKLDLSASKKGKRRG